MEKQDFKKSVLNAVEGLSFEQADKVLNYINTLLTKDEAERTSQFRQNAMMQIREALRKGKSEVASDLYLA